MTENPPEMFRRPTDPPEALPPLRSGEHIVRLHTAWASMHPDPGDMEGRVGRWRNRARVVTRVARGTDHRLLGDVVRAVDAIAARVDELSERVANLTTSTDDLARTLSEEVSRLRGEVQRMSARGDVAPPRPDR